MTPFAGIRWRLAAWNLVVLTLALLVIVSVLILGELHELGEHSDFLWREYREDSAHIRGVLILSALIGACVASGASLFLAGRAMRPIRAAFERHQHFIADASHELRTPVAVLRARAEVLEREGGDLPAPLLQEVHRLRRDADQLSALVHDLLDLARLERGQTALPLEPIALEEVVEEIVEQLQPLALARGIRLVAEPQPVWGQGNLSRVRQVLRALTDNALKHTPSEGQVSVGVAQVGNHAQLTVVDTGRGISDELLPRVFDRFYCADSELQRATERATGGTGLGLAIVAQLVHHMQGDVWLENRPDGGTKAVVRLRIAPAAPVDRAYEYAGSLLHGASD